MQRVFSRAKKKDMDKKQKLLDAIKHYRSEKHSRNAKALYDLIVTEIEKLYEWQCSCQEGTEQDGETHTTETQDNRQGEFDYE